MSFHVSLIFSFGIDIYFHPSCPRGVVGKVEAKLCRELRGSPAALQCLRLRNMSEAPDDSGQLWGWVK